MTSKIGLNLFWLDNSKPAAMIYIDATFKKLRTKPSSITINCSEMVLLSKIFAPRSCLFLRIVILHIFLADYSEKYFHIFKKILIKDQFYNYFELCLFLHYRSINHFYFNLSFDFIIY